MKELKARHVALAALLCGAIAFLAHTVMVTSRPASKARPKPQQSKASAGTEADEDRLQTAAPTDATFARYDGMVERNIFLPPRKPEPPPAKQEKLPTFSKSTTPKTPSDTAKSPDFAGWSYVGYVVIEGRTIGLLQNESSSSAREVAVGDEFLGATVEEITPQEISLKSRTTSVSLSVPRDFPVLNLSKGSSAEPSRPRRARPGAGPPSRPADAE